MSPSFRRTHLPSLRSMAGMRITSWSRGSGPGHGHQFAVFIGDQCGMLFDSQVCNLRNDQPAAATGRPLTEQDAIDIWIARWLRIRRKDILLRYGCDPRRLY